MRTKRYHITHGELKQRIEETYGPYSSESLTFCAILNQLQDKNEIPENYHDQVPKEDRKQSLSIEMPSGRDVWGVTLSYFFARSAFIIGTWLAFLIFAGLSVWGMITFLM